MATRTITISEESHSCIVDQLLSAKNALEAYANEEGHDLDTDDCEFESVDEWREICKALEEIGG